jgi:hypothetical protein
MEPKTPYRRYLDLVDINMTALLRLVGRSVRRARGGVILKSTTTKGGLL